MGFSLQNDLEMKEGVVVELKDEIIEIKNIEMVENVGIHGFDLETEFDFCPIQHPTEPSPHEDRPVQCPMPHPSHLINDERMQDDRFSERKRPEALTVVHKEPMGPPIRTFRKRHHDHTNSNTVTPFVQTSPVHLPHLQLHTDMNTIVLNKLEQVHRFGS